MASALGVLEHIERRPENVSDGSIFGESTSFILKNSKTKNYSGVELI